MSIKNYFKKHTNIPYDKLSAGKKQKILERYYLENLNAIPDSIHFDNSTAPNSKQQSNRTNVGYAWSNNVNKTIQPCPPPPTSTWKNMQDMYTAAGTNTTGPFENLDNWNKDAKKSMAKIGFKYNGEKDVYELKLTATVEIKEPLGLMAVVSDNSNGSMRDEAIAAIKRVKNNLVKKLTAKLILIELTKPREIKE